MNDVRTVYEALKETRIHPERTFDKGERWYPSDAENVNLSAIRSPSKSWPYSYLNSCRTLKHVKAIKAESPELFAKHLKNAGEVTV